MNKWINSALTIKIVSAVLALFLWTYVMTEKNPPMTDTKPNIAVNIINAQELASNDMVIVGNQEFRADVKVKGRRTSVLEVRPSDIIVEADLSQVKKGLNTITLRARVPDKVDLVEINPSTIKINIDEIVRPQREVEVNIIGTPATGFTIMEEITNPSHVTLKGPESFINQVARVVLDVDAAGVNKDFTVTAPLKALDSRGNEVQGVEIQPQTASVDVKVSKTKVIPIKIYISNDLPPGYVLNQIDITPSSVRIASTVEDVSKIEFLYTEPMDLSNITEYTETTMKLALPENIKLINSPDEVTVRLYIEPVIEKELEISNINFLNQGQNTTVKLESPGANYKVTVQGTQSKLRDLRANDIILNINLQGLGEGTHNLPIEVKLPTDVTLKAITPSKLNVIIEPKQP